MLNQVYDVENAYIDAVATVATVREQGELLASALQAARATSTTDNVSKLFKMMLIS